MDPRASAPSMPPSEPRPSSRPGLRPHQELELGDRPMRVQMIVALVLGLVLVSIPLYLWRRPRVDGDPVNVGHGAPPAALSASSAQAASSGAAGTSAAAAPRVQVAEPRFVSCADSKKAKSEGCDHPDALAKAFTQAIVDSSACAPDSAGGGTVIYVADVSLTKKKVELKAPKDSRSLKNGKVVGACVQMIKKKLEGQSFEGVTHDHAKYKLEAVATYSGPAKG
jgi:hypothetical protein